jgi:hypothetical protein
LGSAVTFGLIHVLELLAHLFGLVGESGHDEN